MPDPIADTILVSVGEVRELQAIKADLIVTVKGNALFTGDAALNKAREVGQMVSDLKSLGLTDDDIHLQAIHATASSGTLTRSSSATYTLLIHCTELSRLADVLGVITSQKNTTLKRTIWKYADETEIENELLDVCLQRANDKARRIAAGLGVRLLGIASFEEKRAGNLEKAEEYGDMDIPAFFRRREGEARITTEDLGFAVSHSASISLRVTVVYYISRFADENTPPQRQRAPIPEVP